MSLVFVRDCLVVNLFISSTQKRSRMYSTRKGITAATLAASKVFSRNEFTICLYNLD